MAGTAIIVGYTPEGFVIASDGLQHLREKIISRSEQKIYSLVAGNRQLAYAFSGTTRFVQNKRTILDLCRVASGPRWRTLLRKSQDPATFIRSFVQDLNRYLRAQLEVFPDNDGQGTICELIISGYFEQTCVLARMRFSHRQNILELRPNIDALPLRDEQWWEFLSGSPLIWSLLCDPTDIRLPEYKSPLFSRVKAGDVLSLAETAEVCSKYIQACSDERAAALDPFCASVGGHTHMAEVTMVSGFRWLVPPATS